MTRYLLDTNAVSYAIRNASPHLSRRFSSAYLDELAISVITEAELRFGLARRPAATSLAAAVHALLKKIAILPWTSPAAEHYSVLRAELGRTMDDIDMMIAAHALAEDPVLITSDAAFRRIAHLKVEDWTAP